MAKIRWPIFWLMPPRCHLCQMFGKEHKWHTGHLKMRVATLLQTMETAPSVHWWVSVGGLWRSYCDMSPDSLPCSAATVIFSYCDAIHYMTNCALQWNWSLHRIHSHPLVFHCRHVPVYFLHFLSISCILAFLHCNFSLMSRQLSFVTDSDATLNCFLEKVNTNSQSHSMSTSLNTRTMYGNGSSKVHKTTKMTPRQHDYW